MHKPRLLKFVLQAVLASVTPRAAATNFLHKSREIPGWGGPAWGGRSFSDSPAAINTWTNQVPWSQGISDVLGNLDPAAPFDQVVPHRWPDSITGSAPKAPQEGSDGREGTEASLGMQPDIVPRDLHVPTFPAEQPPPPDPGNPLIPIGQRVIVAKPDRLRVGDFPMNEISPIADSYPLTAPADRMPGGNPWPVNPADDIPNGISRYLMQSHDRREVLRNAEVKQENFGYVDANQDGVISTQEFIDEVVHRQGKTIEEARRLWDWARYNSRSELGKSLTEQEFGRLVRSGFDLVTDVGRDDVVSVLTSGGQGLDRGFWGSGAACPSGHFASGAKLKRTNYTNLRDNTGLNALSLNCDSVGEVSSSQGPDGWWTPLSECPAGQVIYGVQIRTQPLDPGRDNSGVNDLEFSCRPRPVYETSHSMSNALALGMPGELRFAGGPKEGGWSKHLYCPDLNTAICGVQVRLMSDQDEGDDMGVTDVRFYCCGVVENCNRVCKGVHRNAPTVECTACKAALNALPSR